MITQVNDEHKADMAKWLDLVEECAGKFEMQPVNERVILFRARLRKNKLLLHEFHAEIRSLRETIDIGIKSQRIYRYPQDKLAVFLPWKEQWNEVNRAFHSAQHDILAAVDCWALGHNTACVFHSMRILEHGLRALSADVGVKFDVQSWQTVIDDIDSKIRALGKSLPRGPEKSARLQFLAEAAKEFVHFKDGWRNYVSHNRATYDEYQARSVLVHVKSFMTGLAARLSEDA